MAKITIVYWRDIPAQVIAKPERKSGRRSAPGSGPSSIKKELEFRFQDAIEQQRLGEHPDLGQRGPQLVTDA